MVKQKLESKFMREDSPDILIPYNSIYHTHIYYFERTRPSRAMIEKSHFFSGEKCIQYNVTIPVSGLQSERADESRKGTPAGFDWGPGISRFLSGKKASRYKYIEQASAITLTLRVYLPPSV